VLYYDTDALWACTVGIYEIELYCGTDILEHPVCTGQMVSSTQSPIRSIWHSASWCHSWYLIDSAPAEWVALPGSFFTREYFAGRSHGTVVAANIARTFVLHVFNVPKQKAWVWGQLLTL